MIFPEYLKYHEKHMWVRDDGTIGMSDFAQAWLGDLLRLEVAAAGTHVERGGVLGQTESFKFVRDLISPVSGSLGEVNAAVLSEPGIINRDPYGTGWIAVVEMSDPRELDSLMTSSEYGAFVEARLFL
ncbi:MAG: glycine cleavage system protein H [Actinobacteria bacterium]|nr:glycine cleavage system protein H [Actinomycetota bacterium]MBU1944897.1 glycine cleavage system protein H [Actinomycetota bacterium]MBU2688101.1 glycine cleavage system protein H [Actinomycetota bacterium]